MKQLLVTIAIIANLGFNFSAFCQPCNYDILGRDEANKGNYQQALSDFNLAIQYCGDNKDTLADIYISRSLMEYQFKDYKMSIADDSMAISLDPERGIAYHNRGTIYATMRQYKPALADFYSALPHYKNNDENRAEVYLAIGQVQSILTNYKEAIDADNTAISITPTYGMAFWYRGDIYKTMKQYQLAITDYTKAISLYNGDWRSLSELYELKATCDVFLNDFNAGVSDASSALTFSRENGNAYWTRADCNWSLKKYDAAAKDVKLAISYFTDTASLVELYENLGKDLYDSRNYDDAIDAYNHTLNLNPNDTDAFLYRIRCNENLQKYDEALKSCDAGINYYTKDTNMLAQLYAIKGYCLPYVGKIGKSVEAFNYSIKINPKSGASYWDRAASYEDTLDHAHAVNDYAIAISLFDSYDKDDLSHMYKNKGTCERSLGQYQASVNDELKAIAIKPGYAEAYLELGRSYLSLNRRTEAMAAFNNSIQFDSTGSITSFAMYFMGDSTAALAKVTKNMLTHILTPDKLRNDYYQAACITALMHKPAESINFLKEGSEFGLTKYYFRYNQYLVSLRNNSDFIALLKE